MSRCSSARSRRPDTAAVALPWILAALAVSASPATAGGPPAFTEHLRFGASATICVAFADSDGDGDQDLAVGNVNNQQNFLYINDGGLSFTEQAAFGTRHTFALAWADADNDGDRDMAVANRLHNNRLILNQGGNSFMGQNQFGTGLSMALAWADYDLDGDLDIAVGHGILGTAEQNTLYRNEGDGTWTESAQFGVGQTCTLVWGDVDGDGDPDLAAGNGGFSTEEQNYLYVNNGDGTFTERAEFGLGNSVSLAFGDADNDGDLDLAVGNWGAGQSRLYFNDGAGNFTGVDEFGNGDPNTVAWGDFDNDGDLDLAQGNGDFGSAAPNTLWVNTGAGVFTASAQFGLGSTDGVAWADVDGDGDLDLAAGNEHSPDLNYLYENLENDADWLYLRPVGHSFDLGAGYSNRDAIGAKVYAYEAGFLGDPAHLLGVREICAHGGFSSQNQIEAHFGVPGRTAVDVRIVWPGSAGSHVTQDLPGIPVPGRYTVHEGTTATPVTTGMAAPPSAEWRVVPNPSRAGVALDLAGAGAAGSVDIVDAAGRLVRRVAGSSAADDALHAAWDGRDAAGRPVGAGVYFAKPAGREGPSGRIVILH